MKLKTSVTLAQDVLTAIEAAPREGESRFQAIDRLLCESLAERERAAIHERDREFINMHADELNEEAVDTIGYHACR